MVFIKMHHTGLFTQVHKQKSLSLLIYDPGIVIRKNNSLSGSAVSSPSIWITEWNRFALHSHTTKHNQGGLHTLYEQKKSTVGRGYNITHLAAWSTDFLPRVLRLLGSSLIVSGSSLARFRCFFFSSLPLALSLGFPLASFTWLFVSASKRPVISRQNEVNKLWYMFNTGTNIQKCQDFSLYKWFI